MEVACGNISAHVWAIGKVGHHIFHTYDFQGERFVVIYPSASVGEPTVVVEVYIWRGQRPETGNGYERTAYLPEVRFERDGEDRIYLSGPPVARRADENVAISPSDRFWFVGCSRDIDAPRETIRARE